MKTDSFNRKKRQFRNLANRVNHLIFKGEWEKLSAETRNRLIFRLNLMFRELSRFFSQLELKKILAAAAIFIGFPLVSQSQSFAPPLENPFWLIPSDSAYLTSPVFTDIDHDEDLDLFSGSSSADYGNSMQFYENTGSISVPAFAAPQENPFGIIPPPLSPVAFPAFADIDHDGDLDLFIGESSGEYTGNFQFYENTGSVTAPAFAAAQANPFGLTPAYLMAIPEFADIDNDGDLDLFSGGYSGVMNFYENTGNATNPAFAAPVENPFGLISVNVLGSPAVSDIDHDGDFDLFVGEYDGNIIYFENTGNATNPAFAAPVSNPFGLVPTYVYNFPTFADLDNDGDEDLLIGEYYGNFQYFQNTEINIGIPENPQEALFDLAPNPATDGVYFRLNEDYSGKSCEVLITDLAGRAVKTALINTNDFRLTTDDLKPGVYLVRLEQGDRKYTKKLVIR
jgi:hypothetical protein